MITAPVAALLLIEGALRVAGVGYPAGFLVRSADGNGFVTNQKFGVRYYGPQTVLEPFLFRIPKEKAPGTIRICVLGESAAMGTPDPAFAFCRLLEAQLRQRYPGKRFEFMNAAMRGINSYVVRAICADCVRHQVDAVIVYMGNNEMSGMHSPGPRSSALSLWLPLLRAGDWLRATRTGQLVTKLARRGKSAPAQDMALFRSVALPAKDWRRAKVRGNFEANLANILRNATGAGAKVLLCTVPVNLADCPPLGSLHHAGFGAEQARWDELCHQGAQAEKSGKHAAALKCYQEAARLDDEYAEMHFRVGRCCLASGDAARALEYFSRARDEDAIQFRTDSAMNEVIRRVARDSGRGIALVDVEKTFMESPLSAGHVPGAALFHDHVHPTFAGDYLIATNCLPALESALEPLLGKPAKQGLLTQAQCADALGYTLYHELNIVAAMVRLKSRPPFLDQLDHATRQPAEEADIQKRLAAFNAEQAETCVRTCTAALERNPDDWPLRLNLASLCLEIGRTADAIREFKVLAGRYPQNAKFRLMLAAALNKSGDRAAAASELAEAARCDPDDKRIQEAQRAILRR